MDTLKNKSLNEIKKTKYYKNLPSNIGKSKMNKIDLIKNIKKYNKKEENINIIISKLKNNKYSEKEIQELMKKYNVSNKEKYYNTRTIIFYSLLLKKMNTLNK